MSIPRSIFEELERLPPDKQQEVFDFVEFLAQEGRLNEPRPSIKGLCADLGIDITAGDIDEVRQEMWR